MKTTQEYLMYFKEFSCKITENMQARCVPRFIQRFLSIICRKPLRIGYGEVLFILGYAAYALGVAETAAEADVHLPFT